MARASEVTLNLEAGAIPVFTGVLAIAALNRSGGLTSNQDHFAAGVTVDPGVHADREAILYDPQTSGGLLIAADPEAADRVAAALAAAGVRAVRIGTAGVAMPGVHILVRA
jgi:selenide,water dikinase